MADSDQDDGPPARIVLRPIGTALPLGFLSFALGMVLLGAQALGWVPPGERAALGLLLAAYVFPLELLAAVLAFVGRDTFAGTALGLFATTWLATGLVDALGAAGSTSAAVGVLDLGFALVVAALAVVAVPAKPLFAAVLALSSARAVLGGLQELTASPALQTASGAVALVLAAGAAYTGLALLVEAAWPRPVLPLLRRGQAERVLHGSLATPRGLASEPGVRQQL